MRFTEAFLTKPIKASNLYNTLMDILAEGTGPAEAAEKPVELRFDAEMGQRLPLRILVVEDNAINQKLAVQLLERLGYRPDVVGNGVEAIEALRRQSYDVVLMDVQMPEMDGLEATRAIRREFASEDQPRIIAMTAGAMKEEREACMAAGMDDYVSKPIRVPSLVNALSKCQPRSEAKVPEVEESTVDQAATADVLDPAALESLREAVGGDEAFLAELIDAFLEDAPQMLSDMRQALEDEDAAVLRRTAHSLKSNSAEFGATSLSDLCRELEAIGKAGALEGAAGKLAQAEVEFARVEEALEAKRDEI